LLIFIGGTADITVHEKISNGHLKELCHASGGNCGGTSIDNAFIQMVVKILGAPMITLLQQEDPTAYLDLLREFETVKRKIETDTTGNVNFTIPFTTINSLCERHQHDTLSSMIQSSPFASKITLRGDKMRVDADVMKSLFDKTINNIVSLVKDVLRESAAKNVPLLLLVGGFAECPLVQAAMKRNFPNKRIIIPEEAALSVLKGAVLFGHKPDYIASRVMRFSYGTDVTRLFDPKSHEQHRKYTCKLSGEIRCLGLFGEIIKLNESVALGTKISRRYFTVKPNQRKMCVNMYASKKEKPTYVDEDGCVLIGTSEIEILSPSEEERVVSVEYIFGNTEISVTATDKLHNTKCEATYKLI
jgi:molecular chaperone DnaK (HSP70)